MVNGKDIKNENRGAKIVKCFVSVSTKAYCTVQNNCLPLPRFLIKGNNDNSRRTL